MSFAHASLALVSINIFLLIVAVYWTATSWQQLHHVENLPHWTRQRCIIRSAQLSFRNQLYRNEFEVTNFTMANWPDPIPPTIAYRYGTPVYNQTLAQASAFQRTLTAPRIAPCWIFPWSVAFMSPPYPAQLAYTVSMTPVHNAPTKSQRQTAIVSTVFTGITAAFLLILLCAVMCLSPHLDSSLGTINLPNAPSPIVDSLSETEINLLCKTASFANSASVDVCAICLEDEIKINAQLPCGHCFHRRCIITWLQRGNYKCPLCNLALTRDLIHPAMCNNEHSCGCYSRQNDSAPLSASVERTVGPRAPAQPVAQHHLSSISSRSASSAANAAAPQQHAAAPQPTGAT
ncbi:unnamed protein product [Agarophyton chilense]|eukprot:gb/GEZJ01007188.1/.p1 GENE.gb/GEZJ01007188.1/~~gb/GEZJ01007188.1/.p1  ORF type:complete len:347 (-),score=37.46 gb/GEZJ01007188.1/:367-1407(-)